MFNYKLNWNKVFVFEAGGVVIRGDEGMTEKWNEGMTMKVCGPCYCSAVAV